MWGAGEVYGLQTGAPASAGREADVGNGGPCISRNRRPASRTAAGNFDYAIDRAGDSVQAGGNRGAGAVRARAENVLAHGWCADFKRGGGAATDSSAGDARFGRRCAVVWRDEKRVDGRGGGGVLSSGTGRGFFVCAQAGDATGVENALPVGADGGAADGRPLAAKRGALEPDGATAGTGSEEDSASQDCVSSGGERGVCANSAGSDSEDTGALLLLCVERRGIGGAVDVFIRHNRGGRPGVCRVCGGGDWEPGELKAPMSGSKGHLSPVETRLAASPETEGRRTYFLAALTLAHRALWAAAILLRPAAEIVRFLRVAAGPRLLPCRKTLPKVVRAAVTRRSSSSSRARSCRSCLTTD